MYIDLGDRQRKRKDRADTVPGGDGEGAPKRLCKGRGQRQSEAAAFDIRADGITAAEEESEYSRLFIRVDSHTRIGDVDGDAIIGAILGRDENARSGRGIFAGVAQEAFQNIPQQRGVRAEHNALGTLQSDGLGFLLQFSGTVIDEALEE